MHNQEMYKNELILIPKVERYIEYILNMLIKLPRTEKYSIGTEYKSSMYEMLQNILYLNKIENSVKVNIKLIKKYKIKLIKKFNVVFPENVIV